jgi:hypothetical protein
VAKAAQHYSFIVGSKYGPRSAKWIVTIDKSHDVYVTTERARRDWHATLHRSGQWHIKNNVHTPGQPKTLIRSHRDRVPKGKYPVALYILIPDSCLRPASNVDNTTDPDRWLDRPPYSGAVEIAIMEWDHTGRKEEWPGQSAGTQLFAVYLTGETTTILMLWRVLPSDHPAVITAEKMRPKVQPVVLDSPERRVTMFGYDKLGGISIVEYAID